jgi:hypothetical protein
VLTCDRNFEWLIALGLMLEDISQTSECLYYSEGLMHEVRKSCSV